MRIVEMGNIVGNVVSSVTSATITLLVRIILPLIFTLAINNPKTTKNIKSKYDYIVVGAGAAGSVIAARLSEDRCVSVLLLEAGPKALPITEVPALQFFSQNSPNDWGYKTVPQKRGALFLHNRILIDKNKNAYGVKFHKDGKDHEVFINKEVIVSGGTINSPQLLMLSGIGPRKHLEAKGIPVIEDLPVGDNYQDHVGTFFLNFEATGSKDTLQQLLSKPISNLVEYNTKGTGPYASLNGIEGAAWVNSKFNDPSLDWPDLEIHLEAFSASSGTGLMSGNFLGIPQKVINQVYLPYKGKHTFTMFSCFLRPFSRGTVRLDTANPNDYPLIDPNTFANASDIDRVQAVLQENVDIVTKTNAFKEIGAKLFETKFPGCEQFVANSTYYSPEYLRCIAVGYTFNLYHPVGTCKMGSADDKTTVVDPQLKVKGIRNLRVADGSIIPNQVSGNTEAPIVMIGEKCSDMIKADNPDRNNC